MSKPTTALTAIAALLLAILLAAIVYADDDQLQMSGYPCGVPFAVFERPAGSMSLFPEVIRGSKGETVTLYKCGDHVRATIIPFSVYHKRPKQ